MSIRYITKNGKYAISYESTHGDWALHEIHPGTYSEQWPRVCELVEGSLPYVVTQTEKMLERWDADGR